MYFVQNKHVYEFNPAQSSSLQPSRKQSLPNTSRTQIAREITHKVKEASTSHCHSSVALLSQGPMVANLTKGL